MNTPRPILLAEDDRKDVELILTTLAENKLRNEIVVARDGAEALDYLTRKGRHAERPAGHPALILLDLKMPKIDGLEVIRRVKLDSELKLIPIVVLTSSREASDLKQAYSLGANAYVVKPVKFADFIEAVKALSLFWALFNESPTPS